MASNARNLMDKGYAYGKSLIHYKTVFRTITALFIGIFTLIGNAARYVGAQEMKELKEKNPTAWNDERARRRFTLACLLGIDGALFLFLWFAKYKYELSGDFQRFGPLLWIMAHMSLFIWVGRQEPILNRVQTQRMAGQELLRQVTDEMTLTQAARKEGATSEIAVSPHSLRHTEGYSVTVRVHQRGNPEHLLTKVPTLAHKLRKGTGQVFTYQDTEDNSLISFTILKKDPWSSQPTRHPLADNPRPVNLWRESCDLGILPDFSPWMKVLATKGDGGGMLVGGAPRRGKSNLLLVILIYLILDPMCNIHMIDGKQLDFEDIREVCESFIGEDKMEDITLLRQSMVVLNRLKDEIQRRKPLLRAAHAKHVDEELCKRLNLKLEWLFIDELAVLTEDLMSKYAAEVLAFIETLQYIVRMGPAFGVYCVLATQRPSSKSVPDTIRSLIIMRIAFYISTFTGSQAILGKAGPNYRADWLNPAQRGICISVGEGQLRPHMVEDADIASIVKLGIALRAGGADKPQFEFDYPEPVKSMIQIFEDSGQTRLSTAVILEKLEEKNQKYTSITLAAVCRTFGFSPRNVKTLKGEAKGYRLEEVMQAPRSVSRAVYTPSQSVSTTAGDGSKVWLATEHQEGRTDG